MDGWTEIHRCHEAVARGPVDLFGFAGLGRVKRGQRAPLRGREPHRQTWAGIVEWLHDVAGQTLIAVDLAPSYSPAAEVLLHFCERGAQALEALVVRQFVDQRIAYRFVRIARRGAVALDQSLAPENRERCR